MQRSQTFTNENSTLYVVATPIGNLEEISLRVKETLCKVDAVFCEDTRVSVKILQHLQIQKPLFSAYENIEKTASQKIIAMLKEGQNIALLSDAGYPGISDPGQIIISEVIKENFNVAIINGPSALIPSIINSGFPTKHFYFYGFLPPKSSKRKSVLETLKTFPDPIIFYQSPHKIKECLEDLLTVFSDREICLCRELTKKFEEFIRGKISEILPICESLKGEMVLVCSGYQENQQISFDKNLYQCIQEEIQSGLSKSEAIKKIANQYHLKKSEVYQFFHQGEEEYEQ